MTNSNSRIGYIDALRGFTMMLVVFAHVELFCFDIHLGESLIGSIFITFRMPMFFFISGFIAYKALRWDMIYYLKMLKKKSKVQLIPTLFFFTIYHIAFQNGSLITFFTKGPGGFWFTVVLFYMFLLYYSVMLITRNSKSWVPDVVLIALGVIGALVYIGGMKFYNLERFPIFCLTNLSRYFEFFVLGILCRKYQGSFVKIISNDNVKAFLLLSFLGIFIISWQETIIRYSLIHVFNLEFTLRFLGLFLVFSIFYHYRDFFDTDCRTTKAIRFIGRRTLDIYLIHYFLLPDLLSYKDILLGSVAPKNSVIELLIVLFITLLIISMCLLISAIIRSSSILGHYLLGAKLPEK